VTAKHPAKPRATKAKPWNRHTPRERFQAVAEYVADRLGQVESALVIVAAGREDAGPLIRAFGEAADSDWLPEWLRQNHGALIDAGHEVVFHTVADPIRAHSAHHAVVVLAEICKQFDERKHDPADFLRRWGIAEDTIHEIQVGMDRERVKVLVELAKAPTDPADGGKQPDLSRLLVLIDERILTILVNPNLDLEERLCALSEVDSRFWGWKSEPLAELLGLSEGRIRQTEWWTVKRDEFRNREKEERKSNR
jgi:hypothetical protein